MSKMQLLFGAERKLSRTECLIVHCLLNILNGRDDAFPAREKAFIIVHLMKGLGARFRPFIDGFDHQRASLVQTSNRRSSEIGRDREMEGATESHSNLPISTLVASILSSHCIHEEPQNGVHHLVYQGHNNGIKLHINASKSLSSLLYRCSRIYCTSFFAPGSMTEANMSRPYNVTFLPNSCDSCSSLYSYSRSSSTICWRQTCLAAVQASQEPIVSNFT